MNQVANTVILPVEEYEALRAQVAASQAREKVLREALVMWDELIKHQYTGTREAMSDMQYASNATVKALAIPTNTTALDERLKAERERCAKVCDCLATGEGDEEYAAGVGLCVETIRGMK